MKNRKITLLGRADLLKLGSDSYDTSSDTIPRERIIYPDLVFTLRRDGTKYHRPQVMYNEKDFFVVGNKQFFLALIEAGIEKIVFDICFKGKIPLKQLMEERELEFAPQAGNYFITNRFLFFKKMPEFIEIETDKILEINPDSTTDEYQQEHCIQYRISGTPKKRTDAEKEFLKVITSANSQLRSVDGVVKRGIFERYFH